LAQTSDGPSAPWVADLGDGRYRNPVLAGDWSDPDVVQVGDAYYLTSSSFANVPGLPILRSYDLVNWTIIGHALARNLPDAFYATPRRGGGVWAPAIRHRDGRFMIFYADPDRGVFLVTAVDPAGPWSPPVRVDGSRGVIDPAPFWDEDGTGWLVMAWARSRAGFNNRITLKRLNEDGTATVGEGIDIIDGDTLAPAATSIGPLPWETLEGPKLYRRDGWYYVFAPAGGVKPGWQGVFRSRSLLGPYEGRNVLDQGSTPINGPHQGALVEAGGDSWFLHFQDTDSFGRRVHLQPVAWRDGWPVIGADPDGDGIGEPVETFRRPRVAAPSEIAWPQTDDDFDGRLSLAWQWNANPREDWADLTERPGYLRLRSVSVPANLYESGAVLTQKLPGPAFSATTRIDFAPMRVGEQAGLVVFGYDYAWVGLRNTAEGPRLVQVVATGAERGGVEQQRVSLPLPDGPLYLRLSATPVTVAVTPSTENGDWASKAREFHARVVFSYSTDGAVFTPIGDPFVSRPSRWVGAQIGLFAAAPTGTPAFVATSVGHADFDAFRVTR
jgi:beta-xylosidase